MTSDAAVVSRRTRALRLPALSPDAITAWALGFGAVLYLALRGGGYDGIVRGQAGVLAWWLVLLVAAIGLMPRLTRTGWAVTAVLIAWAGWTAIGISGTESAERTLAEVGRLSTYLGVLVLAFAAQGRAGSRHLINGVATAIGVVTVLAVLSRLHPQSFPHNQQLTFLPGAARRLSYPVNYWNALAALMATGAVLLLGVVGTARTRIGQALAAATLPLTGLGVYLCVSRGGAIVLVAGLLIYLLVVGDRLPKLLTMLVAGAGAAILIAAAEQRDALLTGVDTPMARSDGAEMVWLCIIVCAGVALVQVAIGLLERHAERPRLLQVPRRVTAAATGAGAVVIVVAILGTGLGGELSDKWSEFKTPPVAARAISDKDVFNRLDNAAGQGRWQYWESAVDAYKTERLTGIGGGAFALWWPRHATVDGAIVDAHSLYAQTLAETGLVGAALLLALVVLTVAVGVAKALRRQGNERTLIAAATAGVAIFWLDATVEWVWQIAVLPVIVMFLAAVIVGHRDPQRIRARIPARILLAGGAVVALVPVVLVLAGAVQLRQSQVNVRAGRLDEALAAADSAARLQPAAATPRLQRALVLEQQGDLPAAAGAARSAIEAEPTNWQHWLALSRIQARQGETAEALRSFRRSKQLNPRSTVFPR